MIEIKKKSIEGFISLLKAIIIAGLIIGTGLYFGLRKPTNQPTSVNQENSAAELTDSQADQAEFPSITTSIDDDAILGNRETAKIAIVEFSDYECPFCKRHFEQTLSQIKNEYIEETGKAIYVFRDLPLTFHNPAAEQEAMAAECARSQKDDETYYQFHDKIFEKTGGNGQGVGGINALAEIADDLELSGTKLQECIEGYIFKNEVEKDAQDATKAGISGTPGFIVGKLDSQGNVTGQAIKGAYPFEAFKQIIDSYLQ